MARSHIKLWWGDLVISNRASRHPEERNGKVLAFMIADKCLAWWSNAELRHPLREGTERDETEKRSDAGGGVI